MDLNTGICDNCKEIKERKTHSCGSFCDECKPGCEIDISPLTLVRLLKRDAAVIAIYISVWKCPRCLNGLSPKEWQLYEARKYRSLKKITHT